MFEELCHRRHNQLPPLACAGADVDWILAGSGSVSPGSARSRGQLAAAHRADPPPEPPPLPAPQQGSEGVRTRSNPWSSRRTPELSAVGVGYGRPRGQTSQVTWALVPVTTLPGYTGHSTTDEQRSKGTLWSSDVSNSGPQILASSQGSFRPVYLQFYNGSESNHNYASDRGFSLLPSRRDGDQPWSTSLDGPGRDRLSQTWPPPSSTSAVVNQEVRVLTPTQLRGRRVLQPIGAVDKSPDLVHNRGAPRRDAGSSGSRYKMPSLSSPKRPDKTDDGPLEISRPPEISVEDLRTRSPDKSRARRRQHRTRASQDLLQDEMLRLDQGLAATSLRRKGTPPLLVGSAPAQDCTIPQKPVLVRQPVRQDSPPEGAAQQDNVQHSPPVESFLPPVDAAPQQQGRGWSAAPTPLDDELLFQSLDSFDREEAASNHRPRSPEQILSKSLPQFKSTAALDEERERNMKFQQLKEQEAEHISATPQSPASAPAAISYIPETTNGDDGAEVVDLSTSIPLPLAPPPDPPLAKAPPPDSPLVRAPPTDTPPVRMLAPSTPPVIELQLDAGGGDEAELPPPSLAAPAPRTRCTIIPRQLKRNSVAPMSREPLRSRQLAKQSSSGCMFPDTLKPLNKPRESLQMFFHQFDSQEWEVVMQGLQTLVRLCRHHPDTVQAHLHAVLVALARQIRNLRSQVSRAACQAAAELFLVLKRALETDLDVVVAPLFHRVADTNKFLRADSNAALDKMVETISTNRAVTAICSKGASHQHALVRTAATRLLAGIVTRLGAERTMSLPRDTRDKILVTGANLLTEGSLDTRCFAKQMFRVLAAQPNFFYIMTEVVPASVMRNIGKTLQALK